MKVLLLLSICLNIFLLLEEDNSDSKILSYKQQILELKSDLEKDQVASRQSSRRKIPRVKINKTNKLVKSNQVKIAQEADYEIMSQNMDLDDNRLNDKLIDKHDYTQSEIFKMEEIIDKHHDKVAEYFEKRADKVYKPHRSFEKVSPYRKIMKETHQELKKTLGLKKYEAYMFLLDEFNESMDAKRKASEPYYYRSI